MKKYDKYKPTGSPWIGEIPEHWEVKKLSYIGGKITDFVASGSFADLRENVEYLDEPDHAMLVRTADLSQKGNTSPVYVSKESYTFLSNSNLFGGEIILPNIGSVGDVYIVPKDLYPYMTLAPNAIMLNTDYNPYLYYYFLSKSGCEAIKNIAQGTTQSKFNKTELRALKVIIPPQSEQESIVAYLDEKCGSVDKVIAKQERRIALLKELKQSIISEAVTRGIIPDAPLRESGIEWIGKIPAHWEVKKIAHIFKTIGSGTTPSTSNSEYYCEDDGMNWLQTGDLTDGEIIETTKHITDKAITDLNLKIYTKKSLVIAMYGASVGKLGILKINTAVNQACCVLSNSTEAETMYSFYSLLSAKKHLIALSVGGGQPNISQDIIKRHKTPVPPLEEQKEIVDYIETKVKPIDQMIAKAVREIELLREYKQSIITEAVTGKIKVC